jgi:hypothetical protein
MKRIVTVVIALSLGLSTSAAHAGKGIFEAPMVVPGGAEVQGSEGKIERDGIVKAEVPTAVAGTHTLCVHSGDVSVQLETKTLDEDGELKLSGDLGVMTLTAPYLSIHEGTDCTGADLYVSGVSVI